MLLADKSTEDKTCMQALARKCRTIARADEHKLHGWQVQVAAVMSMVTRCAGFLLRGWQCCMASQAETYLRRTTHLLQGQASCAPARSEQCCRGRVDGNRFLGCRLTGRQTASR